LYSEAITEAWKQKKKITSEMVLSSHVFIDDFHCYYDADIPRSSGNVVRDHKPCGATPVHKPLHHRRWSIPQHMLKAAGAYLEDHDDVSEDKEVYYDKCDVQGIGKILWIISVAKDPNWATATLPVPLSYSQPFRQLIMDMANTDYYKRLHITDALETIKTICSTPR
jgi:hypothetical protein